MAKITVTKYLGMRDMVDVTLFPTLGIGTMTTTSTKITLAFQNGSKLVLTGTGLVAPSGDLLTIPEALLHPDLYDGTITGLSFYDTTGKRVMIVDGSYDESLFYKIQMAAGNSDIIALMTKLVSGKNRVIGSDNGDYLLTGYNFGNNTYLAGKGNDTISGLGGSNTYDGGEGWDILSYGATEGLPSSLVPMTFHIGKGFVLNAAGGKDLISNFEYYRGSITDDVFFGTARNETFAGLNGNNKFRAGGGYDIVRYDSQKFGVGIKADLASHTVTRESDPYSVGPLIDKIYDVEELVGSHFDDEFIGDSRNNAFIGLNGVDKYDGGSGTDKIIFNWWDKKNQGPVSINLELGTIADDGYGNTEEVNSIESVSGSSFSDEIVLGSQKGNAWGNDGNDLITAGSAKNILYGGNGADRFIFTDAADSKAGAMDLIADFSRAQKDKLDLRDLDFTSFVGKSAFTGEAGELRYKVDNGDVFLLGDLNGDKKSDFALQIDDLTSLRSYDFLF